MIPKRYFVSVALILSLFTLYSCSLFPEDKQDREPPRELTALEKSLVNASNTFGLNLYHTLNQADSTGNIFISPLSISMALGMVLNGAADSTYEAMQTVLGLKGLSELEINESYQSLTKLLLNLDPHIELTIANSIWYRTGLPVEPDFIKTNQQYFSAQVKALDFLDPQAPATINHWVNQKTNGTIPKIIDSIPHEMIMYLINAVYFKGQWRTPFDKANTHNGRFHNLDGSESTVSFMSQPMASACLFEENLTVLDIPYSDSLYSLTIVLPEENHSQETISGEINQAQWGQWIRQLSPCEIELVLPKLTIEYQKSLNEILSAMGMGIAFDPNQANFSRMANISENIYISEIKHKASLKIDEEGTTASAATSVGIGATSAPPRVIVDHPFLVAIRENHSGTILFIGRIATL